MAISCSSYPSAHLSLAVCSAMCIVRWVLCFLVGFSAASAQDFGFPADASDSCNDSCQADSVPLIQLGRPEKGCADELWARAAEAIKGFKSSLSESQALKVFEQGCNPNTSPLPKELCIEVKAAHEMAVAEILGKLNSLDSPPLMSFADFAVIVMFDCMWKNRQDEFDTAYVGKPYNVCPLDKICGGITSSKDFETLTSHIRHTVAVAAVLDEAWPGTGEVYPMLRVTLLHKSDGAAAPETTQGSNGLRVSCINGGWALPCNLHVKTVKYSQSFQIAWGPERHGMRGINPLSLQSAVVSVPPGQHLENFSDTGVIAKMPPPAGNPITMVIIGDSCNGNMKGFGQCNFRAFYGVNLTLPLLLNAALKSSDLWYLTGDNFYDRYGLFSVSIFAQLNKEAQGIPLLATPGNHDYWFNGIPNTGANSWLWGYDQFANGHAQFFAQDSHATFEPKAPAADQIYPSGTPVERFSAANGGFLNFEATPKADARPENFYHYSIAGNIGFVMFTCVGGDPRSFVREACSFMKAKNPKLVLFLGHWNMAGSGCPAGRDVPSIAKWALKNTDCSAFAGSNGKAPFGQIGRAASRLKFIVGHQHCNCMTNFERIAQNSCLPDEVAPNLVDGFLIGSHGMSWDPYPGAKPECSPRFGLPVLRTDDNKLTFAYAKLSLEVMPGEPVTSWQLYTAFLGHTPAEWSHAEAGPYGAGILNSKLTALLSCLKEKGTNQCSRNASLFDQWYSSELV